MLKKPSCTKYILAIYTSGNVMEHKYVSDIEKSNAKFIIYKSPHFEMDNIAMSERVKLIDRYIKNNYTTIYQKNGYTILKKL